MSTRARTVILMVVALAGTASACGEVTPGKPSAIPGSATETSSAPSTSTRPSPTTTSGGAAGREYSGPQMCELLTAAEAERLGGAPKGKPSFSTSTGNPDCSWTKDTTLVLDFGKVAQSKNLRTGPGITNTPTTVHGLTAVRSLNTSLGIAICQVAVDISATSMMAFGVTVHDRGEGKYEPCDVANKLADIVIPKIKG